MELKWTWRVTREQNENSSMMRGMEWVWRSVLVCLDRGLSACVYHLPNHLGPCAHGLTQQAATAWWRHHFTISRGQPWLGLVLGLSESLSAASLFFLFLPPNFHVTLHIPLTTHTQILPKMDLCELDLLLCAFDTQQAHKTYAGV